MHIRKQFGPLRHFKSRNHLPFPSVILVFRSSAAQHLIGDPKIHKNADQTAYYYRQYAAIPVDLKRIG